MCSLFPANMRIWITIIIITSIFSLFNDRVWCLEETKFFAGSLCDIQMRLRLKCTQQMPSISGLKQCIVQCVGDKECVGASTDQENNCFIHRDCPALTKCFRNDGTHLYLSKNCTHGGTWVPGKNRCRCVNGWVGESCRELPHDCKEIAGFVHEYALSRIYLNLEMYGLGLIPVLCHVIPAKNLAGVVLLRNGGNADFNKSWEDYRSGFAVNDDHFWFGLDSWKMLNRAGYKHLTITINLKTMDTLKQNFHHVAISDAADGYRFTFSMSDSYFRNNNTVLEPAFLKVCLDPYQNVPFSAFDHDEDSNPNKNCASIVGSGWWFQDDCYTYCNLFGWGPSHWHKIAQNQRIHVSGMSSWLMDEFHNVFVYLSKDLS